MAAETGFAKASTTANNKKKNSMNRLAALSAKMGKVGGGAKMPSHQAPVLLAFVVFCGSAVPAFREWKHISSNRDGGTKEKRQTGGDEGEDEKTPEGKKERKRKARAEGGQTKESRLK